MNKPGYKKMTLNSGNENTIRLLPDKKNLPGEEAFKKHWHERMELLRIYDGDMDIDFGNEIIHAGVGELVIICPRESHQAYAGKNGVFFDCIMFELDNFYNSTPASARFLKMISSREVSFSRKTSDSEIVNAFDSLRAVVNASEVIEILESIMLIYRLIKLFYEKCLISQTGANTIEPKFKSLLDYIDTHYCENLTTSSLCRQFGYSEGYFCRLFKKTTFCTVSEYIRERRLNHAKLMLYETDNEIRHISNVCGFSNERYFSTEFRKYFGTSPSQLRKKHSR